MVRINLLPTELIERRKFEHFYPYVFIAGAVMLAVVMFSWLGLQFLLAQSSRQLQQTEETVSTLNRQAEALAIFEQQRQELAARQQVVTQALAGRIDMGKVLEEVSLVLPEPLWLDEVTLNEETGAMFTGFTPETGEPELGEGYKSLAACLVRLNSLEGLYDVWLTSAETDDYQDFLGDEAGGSADVVVFKASAKIGVTSTSTAQTAVPAPPTAAQ